MRIGSAGKDSSQKMPKPPKRTQPSVDLREDEPKEITVSIRTSVHEGIIQYIAFHEESMGYKPNESKVVDHGMKAFFESDEGFQTYLKKRAKTGNQPAQQVGVGEGKKGGEAIHSGRGRGTSLQGE